MANRLLKDWTKSDKVNSLSALSERFFTRLIMKADDFGCYYADSRILKADLFPLLLDSIREADLLRWMAECQKAGLIVLYESESKKYLRIIDFGQRLRQKTSKFPMPDNCQQHADNGQLEEKRSRREVEIEGEEEVSQKKDDQGFIYPKNEEKKGNSPGPEIFYTIEHCLTVAMSDERWVNNNKASPELLQQFNDYLEGTGVYEKNPMDYKSHFHRWKNKQANGTHQQAVTRTSVKKSAGAVELTASLNADIAGLTGS